MDLSQHLLKMIQGVSTAEDAKSAAFHLLYTLLSHLRMDQAALCEISDGNIQAIFAIDRTKKILDIRNDTLWISQTLIMDAFVKQEPISLVYNPEIGANEDMIPPSISQYALQYALALPVSQDPGQVVFLASRSSHGENIIGEELERIKIAAQAATLALQQQRHFSSLKVKCQDLSAKLKQNQRIFLYASPAMENLVQQVERVSVFNVSVLLQGESGSGKEEVARTLHQLSQRSGRFVAVNCANLSETLLESELFGYTRGAFTGAVQNKIGLFQEAEAGTFFLDEIGDLPLSLQAKLLRVIQERVVRPLGGAKDIPINIRLVAASHKDLWQLVQEKKFREDLYYRIQEIVFLVPPLRDRREDIVLLANHFIQKFSQEFQLPQRKLTAKAVQLLVGYSWPGNIRELKNICRMAVLLSNQSELDYMHIPLNNSNSNEIHSSVIPASQKTRPTNKIQIITEIDKEIPIDLKDLIGEFERELIHKMIQETGGTQAEVADRLGISIRTLQRSLH